MAIRLIYALKKNKITSPILYTLLPYKPLGIWEVISLEDVMRKIFTSLFVIFVASVIVLFIFLVLIKDSDKD